LRAALFGVITQRVVVISYRRFGITHQLPSSGALEMGPIGCPETSVKKITSARCEIARKSADLIYFTAEALTQKLIDIPKQKTTQQLKSRSSKNENTGDVR